MAATTRSQEVQGAQPALESSSLSSRQNMPGRTDGAHPHEAAAMPEGPLHTFTEHASLAQLPVCPHLVSEQCLSSHIRGSGHEHNRQGPSNQIFLSGQRRVAGLADSFQHHHAPATVMVPILSAYQNAPEQSNENRSGAWEARFTWKG